ncbi:MAG: AzlC family ABC transporter permease [Chlamydiales bacterium]|nr:AzlC family ABC transporter permease [Chlamydiales bacterium]
MNSAFKHSLPAIFCYFPLGIVYGVLFTQHGFPWYYAPLFSAFVYAGAMQFLALLILSAGGSLLTLALALIPLGIRNIFYGMTLFERYKNCNPFLRIYLAHGLVDATYSILLTNPRDQDEKKDLRYIKLLTVIIHLSWILGTLLGTVADVLVEIPKGLEFSLTAFFAASAVEQIRKKREFMPILIALASIVIALYAAPNHLFLTGLGIAAVAILALPNRERKKA